MSNYQVGEIVTGIVTGLQPYGAFVTLDDGTVGLIHISEISDRFVRNVEDYLRLGDRVAVRLLAFEADTSHAKLSLKQSSQFSGAVRREIPITWRQRKQTIKKYEQQFLALSERTLDVLESHYNKEEVPLLTLYWQDSKLPLPFSSYQERIRLIHHSLVEKTGLGSDYLGWYKLPTIVPFKDLQRIETVAQEIQSIADTLVVCGIGGSYLSTPAVLEMSKGCYSKSKVDIIYLGNTLSPIHTAQVLDLLRDRNFAVNVISKSGTTIESAIGFRLLKEVLEKRYSPEELQKRIIVTTDQNRGVLHDIALNNQYTTFVIPDDVGGRYSVFTPVGLFPLAVAGINIFELIEGARLALDDCSSSDLTKNQAYCYSIWRHQMMEQGKLVELLVNYEPSFRMFAEWWKQLFGESEGKQGKGIFPASVIYTTDLHSLGQYVQEGTKHIIETTIQIKNHSLDVEVPFESTNSDGLNYLAGSKLSEINNKAMRGTIDAHTKEGNVPNLLMVLRDTSAKSIGYLLQFMMISCAASAYLLGVNPFNQPGVEVYKRNMFKLLGK